MASNLRVDSIVPATGGSVSIGTATGGVNIPGVLTYEDVTNVDSVGVITARTGIKIGPSAGVAATIFADGSINTSGIITATTFHGSGANLTSLPSAQLAGALPAISGANLTGIAATDNVRTGILDVAGVSTFRNTMNVGAAVTISESGIEASGIGITGEVYPGSPSSSIVGNPKLAADRSCGVSTFSFM